MRLTSEGLHNFFLKDFRNKIRRAYRRNLILREPDLQAYTWHLIRNFLRKYDPTARHYRVFNEFSLRRTGMQPDLVIFNDSNPWVVIELKKEGELKDKTRKQVRQRLYRAKTAHHITRGYLVWVARRGDGKVKDNGFSCEIPVTLRFPEDGKKFGAWKQERDWWHNSF